MRSMGNRVVAVIPTLNEEDSIDALVEALLGYVDEVLVIDAGLDQTLHLARHRGAYVLGTRGRPGLAAQLQLGWKLAVHGLHAAQVLQLDAGGSHDPHQAPRLLELAHQAQADLVLGSRFLPGSEYRGNPRRRRASRLAARLCNLAQRHAHWSDWTSGYRLFTADAVQTLLGHTYQATMHAFQIESLAWAGADGLRIIEAPITYTAGRSSLDWRAINEASLIWTVMPHSIGPRRVP